MRGGEGEKSGGRKGWREVRGPGEKVIEEAASVRVAGEWERRALQRMVSPLHDENQLCKR